MQQWQQQGVVRRPGDKNDAIAVFARTTHTSPNARNSSEAGKDDSHSASTAVNASTNADTSANAASGAASALQRHTFKRTWQLAMAAGWAHATSGVAGTLD